MTLLKAPALGRLSKVTPIEGGEIVVVLVTADNVDVVIIDDEVVIIVEFIEVVLTAMFLIVEGLISIGIDFDSLAVFVI